jgi:uncharacterized membrane protein YphA (DoxX/SURF4 family)
MTTLLWIVQAFLALAFLLAGLMKISQPKARLAQRMGWVEDFSQEQVRLIGLVEILGALGLVFPLLLQVLPVLTPLAALGLILTMTGAIWTHIRRRELARMMPSLVLGALAVFVAYGYLALLPVQ